MVLRNGILVRRWAKKCRLQIRFCFGSVYSFMQFYAVGIFSPLDGVI